MLIFAVMVACLLLLCFIHSFSQLAHPVIYPLPNFMTEKPYGYGVMISFYGRSRCLAVCYQWPLAAKYAPTAEGENANCAFYDSQKSNVAENFPNRMTSSGIQII